MTVQTVARALLTRIGAAIDVRSPATAVRRDGRQAAARARLITTLDPWIAEDQWLARFPAGRREHFGWSWWQGS